MSVSKTDLLARAFVLGHPRIEVVTCGRTVAGSEEAWRDAVARFQPGELTALAVELERHAEQAGRHARAAAQLEAPAEPTAEELENEAMLIENERTKAEEDFERFTRERPARIEALLERAVALLERQAGVSR